MPCYKPLQGFHKLGGGITFSPTLSNGSKLTVPCGRCLGCRLAHSRMWAIRMMQESRYHADTCFITLTYSEEHLPLSGQLVKRHPQLFLKRLRSDLPGRKISYYLCGEYGSVSLRPHYHAIMFGWRPGDAKLFSEGDSHNTYTSERLETLWGLGFCTLGDLTPETCAYTARYVTKKISGTQAETHYERLHTHTGEIVKVPPEFALMSRNPAIGRRYYEEHNQALLDHDNVIHNGNPAPLPRYYDKLREKSDPGRLKAIKEKRVQRARKDKPNNTPERLAVREECKRASIHSTRGN